MKFENTKVFNIEGAIRGMRNPLDSWNHSDSIGEQIGEKDMDLILRLTKAGPEHRKFARQIIVSVDITAPRYWWAEFDTYKVGTSANSCSTMHTLMKQELSLDNFEMEKYIWASAFFQRVLCFLYEMQDLYAETKDIKYLRLMKQALPEGFLQKRTVTMNYENVLNMLNQRSSHRLKEWSVDFNNWAINLPYMSSLYENF